MTTNPRPEEGSVFRIGSVAGIIGSLLAMVGNLLHPPHTVRPQGEASAEGWSGELGSTLPQTLLAVRELRRLLDQIQLPGAGYSLGAAAHPQLAVEVIDVGLDRTQRDEEATCDLHVGLA
jgi:hypothetical protein